MLINITQLASPPRAPGPHIAMLQANRYQRADSLAQIDLACRDCEQAINSDGDFALDRGRQARIALDKGATFIHALDDPSVPVALSLRIDEVLLCSDYESPRDLLIARLEEMADALRKGGA